MIRLIIKGCLIAVFLYVAYVFFYGGKKPSYFDYFLLAFAVVTALCFDWKSIERKTGQKVSLKGNFEFISGIYKEMFHVLSLRRWREGRRARKENMNHRKS